MVIYCCVCCQVNVYSYSTNIVKKSISRFHESAYSGQFRRDGQLLVAGEEQGNVKVFLILLRKSRAFKFTSRYLMLVVVISYVSAKNIKSKLDI